MHGSGLYCISLQDMFPGQKRTPHTAKTSESLIESASSKNLLVAQKMLEQASGNLKIAFASKDMLTNKVAKNGIYCKCYFEKSQLNYAAASESWKTNRCKNELVDE